MSCDQCHEREAVIHLTQIVNEQVTTLHLCERCAAEKGVESPAPLAKTPLGELPRRHGQGLPSEPGAPRRRDLRPLRRDAPGLPRSGRLGCSDCYRTFEVPLRDLLRRLHGSTHHLGERYAEREASDAGRTAGRHARAAGAAAPGGRDRELRAGRRAAGPAQGAGMIDLSLLTDGGVGLAGRQRPVEPPGALDPDPAGAEPRRPRLPGPRTRRPSARRSWPRSSGPRGSRVLLRQATRFRLDRLDRIDRQLLHERHLVSKELAGLDADGRVRSGASLLVQDRHRGHAQRGGSPPAPGPAIRASRWRRRTPRSDRLDAELGQRLAFAFHPEFGYLTSLSDQRRDRAPRLGADPPARPGADQGNHQGSAGAGPGRADASAACTGRAARSSATSSSCRTRPRWASPSRSCWITWARWSAR